MATNGVPATLPVDEPVTWEFSAAVMAYFVPDSREYSTARANT